VPLNLHTTHILRDGRLGRGRGVDQGHRSIKRLGGERFQGAFWNEKGMHLKFFSQKCWQQEGGGGGGKIIAII
jgi:hypothetical protein